MTVGKKKVGVVALLLVICVLANYHVGRYDSFKQAVEATKEEVASDVAFPQQQQQQQGHDQEAEQKNEVSLSTSHRKEQDLSRSLNIPKLEPKKKDLPEKVTSVLTDTSDGSHHLNERYNNQNRFEKTAVTDYSVFRKEDYRFCQIHPKPQLGRNRTKIAKLEGGLPLYYQCTGEPYQNFMQLVYKMMQQKHTQNPNLQWGKRQLPVPRANTTIVVLGNSHTRQVMSTLICQYQHLVLSSTILADVPGHVAKGKNVAMKIELQNNLTFYVLINHPFVYSKRWPLTLSVDLLDMSLKSVDLIVLGDFNELVQSFKSNFLKTTLEYQKAVPRHKVNIEDRKPPYIDDVAAVFHGPILYLSMFARYSDEYYKQAIQMIESLKEKNPKVSQRDRNSIQRHNQHQRTNIRSVYGRNYIDPELGGHECSSDSFQIVGTCNTDPTSKRYSDGHRCVGPNGGQTDLIAWDLVETLYELLG